MEDLEEDLIDDGVPREYELAENIPEILASHQKIIMDIDDTTRNTKQKGLNGKGTGDNSDLIRLMKGKDKGKEMGSNRNVLKEKSTNNSSVKPSSGSGLAQRDYGSIQNGALKGKGQAQVGVNLILDKDNHSVCVPNSAGYVKPSKKNIHISSQSNSSSLIHRTGKGGGRPPEDRNMVVLRGRKVVKKTSARSRVFKSLGIPSELIGDKDVATVEGNVWM